MTSQIKLIVGLANPGALYSGTRHNTGAWYVEFLAQRYNATLQENRKFFGYTSRISIDNKNLRLLIPTTFMNHSGTSVFAMAKFFRIMNEEILVAHDDINLPVGIAKFKNNGHYGSHNGLKDINIKLGQTSNFHRLSIGVGHPGDRNKVVKFVLDPPLKEEKQKIIDVIHEATVCTELWFKHTYLEAMNRLHNFQVI
ncbi:aminoacyl-tRNA hydrolase [Candidatus Erwinia haradaeae]|uniref:Peptidyl-tRNA hydrolase n=1 Tax=Candidatus Erwinia haradaeae TaxID=1922217 RepID=A0A803FTY6_9GAMM|nr:aminoacyl-tRNA hydrolase [Candidatus Erwinia haradaeae]VFP88361.1 Peptidyl-tRNA hydrolase [Candidatus Erwinia haradaeae]